MIDRKIWWRAGMVAVTTAVAAGCFVVWQREGSVLSRFSYDAGEESILWESGSMKSSKSPDWWVNSGALMRIDSEGFSTNQGALPKDDRMRKLYAKANPRDTDDGYYPQNIFRLVTRSRWQNFSQEVYFRIEAINLSKSEYREESNGVLLFNRYQDGDNLYYTGVRVDGTAVIKKKIGGKYHTLKQKRILTGDGKYDRVDSPNLLPTGSWIGIRSEVMNDGDEADIKLFLDRGQGDGWQLVLEAHDEGDEYGKEPFLEDGYAGIRTDFMDVRFKGYDIKEISR